jgi:hypothetical protein
VIPGTYRRWDISFFPDLPARHFLDFMPTPFRLFAFALAGLLLVGCDSGSNVPSDLGNNSTLALTTSSTSTEEGDDGNQTVSFDVVAQDPGFKDPFTVDVVALLDESSVEPKDIILPESNTLTFPRSTASGDTKTFTFEVRNDFFPENSETIIFELQNLSGDVSLTAPTRLTVTVEPSDTEVATVSEARSTPEGGLVDVAGIVTRTAGSVVYLQDRDAGIAAFDGGGAFSGDVQTGTELRLIGEISEFNGLLQVVQAEDDDSFQSVRGLSDVPVPDPVSVTVDEVTSDGETYESRLVTIEGLTINESGDFEEDTNYTAEGPSGSMTLRIDDDSFYVGEPIPSDAFTFTGVVGEFRGTYQLLPLAEGDIQ